MNCKNISKKNSCITIAVTLFSLIANAQVPLQFNFQASARYKSGEIMIEKDIKVRINIRNEEPTGKAEYTEVRSVHTNLFGMFTIAIGSKDAFYSSGSLKNVQWGNGKKYLQIEVDPNGKSNYIDLGTTQLMSVPFALFSLETANKSNTVNISASNGLSLADTILQIGNNEGDTTSMLTSNREIPLNGHSLRLSDGGGNIKLSKGLITLQQDSSNFDGIKSGGPFMMINPIYPRPDALPFLFNNSAFPQNNGSTSPNEVVIWGHNLDKGGGAYIPGLPGIGYSLESNYKPSIDSRFVESHEFYITPKGEQIRLKSYTIDTKTNDIDFYHTADNLYLKKPSTGLPYYYIFGTSNFTKTQYVTAAGNFNIFATSDKAVVISNDYDPGDRNLHFYNWDMVSLPGFLFTNNATRFQVRTIPENDYSISLGDHLNRWADVSSRQFRGENLMLKSNWSRYENIIPTATLDISGQEGFSQLRMRASYTPSSSNDTNGEVGTAAWDEDYIYIKTSSGWKRSTLSAF